MRVRHLGAALAIALSTPVFLPGPAGAGAGCHRNVEQGQTEGKGPTVEMVGNCFGTTVVRVAPGTEVTWVNRDEIAHRVDGVSWSVRDDVAGGAQATLRFDAEGTYPYVCVLHPGMFGAVVVGDGAGSASVTNPIPPTSLVAARAAVDRDDAAATNRGWGLPAVGLGALLVVAGFAGGRASRRGSAALS